MLTIALNNFLYVIRRYEEMAEWLRVQQDAGRDKPTADDLARICQQEIGLPFSVVQHASPEAISGLLHQGINPRERAILLAGLLALESELNREAGDAVGQVRASLQAFCLLGEAMESLGREDRDLCRPKLEKLAGQLREAGDDPYLQQKLRRFGF